MKDIVIGGEEIYSPMLLLSGKKFDLAGYLDKSYPSKNHALTFGGYHSLMAILGDLSFKEEQHALLPSYLCPSLLIPFEKLKIRVRFYKVNPDLRINTSDLLGKTDKNTRAVLFINYFGSIPDRKEQDALNVLKRNGLIPIEDMVQNLFSEKIIGNYAFNSLRKFFPVDGSVIIADNPINPANGSVFNKYFWFKSKGQFLRYLHIIYGARTTRKFLKSFEIAEEHYHVEEQCGFNPYFRYLLSKLDFTGIIQTRMNNFNLLFDKFRNISLYQNPEVRTATVGFPVILKERDRIRQKLKAKNIYCPVHWKLPGHVDRNDFPESHELAGNIMTIPVNQRIGNPEMQYLIKNLEDLL